MNNGNLRIGSILVLVCTLMSGCATTVSNAQSEDGLLESYNRAMFKFNDSVDKAVLKPVAQGYKRITPDVVDQGITNFFSNLDDVIVIANDLLQLKFGQAADDTSRLVINSTLGLLGLFDLATPLGLPKHDEDFGQTLGHWGVGPGYYVVLPLLGPSTTRDVWTLPVDYLFNPVSYVDPAGARFTARGISLIDFRADLLQAESAFGDAALDPYTFQREAYLQRRQALVTDGAASESEDDIFDELESSDDLESAPATEQ